MSALDDFRRFVSDAQQAAYYSKWVSQNPGLVGSWNAFRDAILAGGRPTVPDMGTNFYGRSLVDAGIAYLNATAPAPAPTPTPPAPAGNPMWAASSPWNTPIPAGTPKAASSDAWMAYVKSQLTAPYYVYVNASGWTPFFYSIDVSRAADKAAGWGYHDAYGWYRFIGGGAWKLAGVPLSPSMPVPHDFDPNNTDNPCYILDEQTRIWYCVAFTPGKQASGDWHADGGSAVGAGHAAGSGWWDNGTTQPIIASGGGSIDVGGAVHLHELQAGQIPHALKFAMPSSAHRGPRDGFDGFPASRVVLPATRADGNAGDNASAPPYGSHYQLDPALDVDAFTTDAHLRVFLRALQEFGAYDTDSNGGTVRTMGFYGSSPHSLAYPWRPGGPTNGTSSIYDKMLAGVIDRMRIVDPPSSVALESPATIGSSRYTRA